MKHGEKVRYLILNGQSKVAFRKQIEFFALLAFMRTILIWFPGKPYITNGEKEKTECLDFQNQVIPILRSRIHATMHGINLKKKSLKLSNGQSR